MVSTMSVSLQTKSGKVIRAGLDIGVSAKDATVEDLSRAIFKAYPAWNVARQRLSNLEGKVLEKGSKLESYSIGDGGIVVFKVHIMDLGPQIGWTTVFLLEYLGPILIHAFIYFNQSLIYGKSEPMSLAQTYTFYCVVAHFVKRELETLFVHKFSNDTMPLKNLPKNCTHYWILGGLMLAYPIYRPGYIGLLRIPESWIYSALGLFIYAECSNFVTHKILSDLRPAGSRARKIPFGYGFNFVSCPNYTYEILGWIAVTLISGSVFSLLFTIVGAGQMYVWAVKKHQRYLKEFGDKYPKNRKIIVPFLL
ncbi:3-oxo-5a-steroid 4- dehydrogenase [Entophlyctis luteolus]|nr:3-oxo-5a-steroid 4- dehydrogenase [Entophlyctis luteolus]KAJ3387122.1 3-oxo-5a-steroid 4- dehydrogenase [Entophlyctis sp. JEL0112]